MYMYNIINIYSLLLGAFFLLLCLFVPTFLICLTPVEPLHKSFVSIWPFFCPNSPNTAPATHNDSPKFRTKFSKTAETSFPMRDRSELDPRMKPSVRNPPRNRGYFSRSPRAFSIEKYNISRSGYHSKFHRILRLPRKVTLQLHQILRLPRKMTLMINPRHTWNASYNARNNRWHPPTWWNGAPIIGLK